MNEPKMGLPLPADAVDKGPAPGGAGDILVFEVPRGRDIAAAEERTLVTAGGWVVDAEEVSPRGSVRMVFRKGTTVVKVSVAGDAERASLIVTLP